MTTYSIGVVNTTNIVAKLASLNLRIPVNLEIMTTFTSATYDNINNEIIYVFGGILDGNESKVLNRLQRIIVEESPTLSEYPRARIIQTTKTPGIYDDDQNGYTVNCVAVNSSSDASYVCTDNTVGAAIWKQITLPYNANDGDYLRYNSGAHLWEASQTGPQGPQGAQGPQGDINIIAGSQGDILQYDPSTSTWEAEPGLWEDLRVTLVPATKGTNGPPEYNFVTDDGLGSIGVFTYWYVQTSIEDSIQSLYFTAQLPHSYLEGSDLYPHVHWFPKDNTGGTVTWGLEYTWANSGSPFPITSTITATDNAPTVALQHVITNLGTISGTGKKISSVLMCRIYRGLNDTYENAAGLLELDFHYQQQGTGSRTQLTK